MRNVGNVNMEGVIILKMIMNIRDVLNASVQAF
jgi:hypothetical protein